MNSRNHRYVTVLGMCVLMGGAGCTVYHAPLAAREMSAPGLVVVLPGIEGRSLVDANIRSGLNAGNVKYAVRVEEWGSPVPVLKMLVNQTNVVQARFEAGRIAGIVANYQRANPGKPVYLLGDSAGGGMAVFVLESLADMHVPPIDGAILLSPSVSSDYDLTKAIGQSRQGIVCFFNTDDVDVLGVGTAVFGNVDGGRSASAGRVGFTYYDLPQRANVYGRLYHVQVFNMTLGGVLTHLSSTEPMYVAMHVAPWINDSDWPVNTSEWLPDDRH